MEVTEGPATHDERVRLQLNGHDTVYRIERVRRQGVEVFLVETVRLPATLFPGLPNKSAVGDISALAREYDLVLGEAIERISTGVASEAVANALGVAVGSAVLQLDRVVHVRDGRPAEWRTAYGLDRDERLVLLL